MSGRASADGVIVTSLFVTGGLVVVREAKAGNAPPIRFVIGLTVTGVGLAVLSQAGAPNVARGLALLVMATSAVVYGGPAWNAIGESVKPAPVRPTTTQTPRYA